MKLTGTTKKVRPNSLVFFITACSVIAKNVLKFPTGYFVRVLQRFGFADEERVFEFPAEMRCHVIDERFFVFWSEREIQKQAMPRLDGIVVMLGHGLYGSSRVLEAGKVRGTDSFILRRHVWP